MRPAGVGPRSRDCSSHAVAASANVVAIGVAGKNGSPVTFWQFTRYGVVVTLRSCPIAWVDVWLH